jgi:hypothetical protein
VPELRYFEPTWFDREAKKAVRKLSPRERARFEEDLASLLETLLGCRHPATDPALAHWRPVPYSGVVQLPTGFHLVEYHLSGLARIIAGYREGGTVDQVLLLAVTVRHDHARLKRLIQAHRRELTDFTD